MSRLDKILTYLSDIVKERLFELISNFIDDLKSTIINHLLVIKRIPFDIINSSIFKTIIDFLEKNEIIDIFESNLG